MSQIDWQQVLKTIQQEQQEQQKSDPTIKILLEKIAKLEAEGALNKEHPKHAELQLTKKNLETYKNINTGWEFIDSEFDKPQKKNTKR